MTREELKENICGMTYDDMFEYIYSLESRTCINCKDYHNGHCLLPKIGHRYNRSETFGCTDFKENKC